MALDLTKIIEQALAQAPAIIGAVGIAYWRIKKRQEEAIENQKAIKKQLDGHTTLLRKASKAQGRYEGLKQARAEAHNDLEHAVKTVKTVAKRGSRKTDKP